MALLHYISDSEIIGRSANAVHVMKMCSAFATAGLNVTLHANLGSGTEAEAFSYYDTTTRFSLIRHEEIKYAPVRILLKLRQSVPLARVGSLPSLLYAHRKLAPALLRAKPDFVYGRSATKLYAAVGRAPFGLEKHAPPANAMERWIESQLFRQERFRGLVVISDALKRIYLDLFPLLSGRILMAHDGADDPRPEAQLATGSEMAFNVGYVGNLYSGRGVDLIFAVATLLPQMRFHIVGGSAENAAALGLTAIPDNIQFYGHISPLEIKSVFHRFDAVLAPYQSKVAVHGNSGNTATFMSPLKLFEYMSWGKAILASDLPVLHEILRDGENALLLDATNAEAWAQALRKLSADRDLCEKLGRAARADFITHHTWQRRAEKICTFLNLPVHRQVSGE